jgi:hypothetical protein
MAGKQWWKGEGSADFVVVRFSKVNDDIEVVDILLSLFGPGMTDWKEFDE